MTDMTQTARYPQLLDDLVEKLAYKDRWVFDLVDLDRGQGSQGLTLQIAICCPDAYDPGVVRSVLHWFIVPAAAYDERAWRRWLFDRVLDVETHEACEFFQVDDDRPFAPNHGPGRDPYVVHEVGTDIDRRTSFRGDVKELGL